MSRSFWFYILILFLICMRLDYTDFNMYTKWDTDCKIILLLKQFQMVTIQYFTLHSFFNVSNEIKFRNITHLTAIQCWSFISFFCHQDVFCLGCYLFNCLILSNIANIHTLCQQPVQKWNINLKCNLAVVAEKHQQ